MRRAEVGRRTHACFHCTFFKAGGWGGPVVTISQQCLMKAIGVVGRHTGFALDTGVEVSRCRTSHAALYIFSGN